MHPFITLRKRFIVVLFSAGLLAACTRITSTDVGAGLIPPIDGVITQDTLLDVITDNFDNAADTARVYKGDNHALGVITNDPLFGKTNASMFFELKPPSYPFYIAGNKDSLVIDSAVLILSYRGSYGDSTQPLRLTVSEISQSTPLDPARAYPVNYPAVQPVSTGAALGPSINVDIRRLADSVNNRYEASTHQIRIPLFSSVAKRFLKDYDSTNAYINDSTFRTYFAGFGITVQNASPANALLYVNLVDTNTKFALYYSSSSTGATQRDTSVAYFRFNTATGGDANFVVRDRTGSEAVRHFTTTSKPDSLVYVQTSPGTYVRLRIPGLQNLNNRIIHRAELITEQVPDDANLATQMLPPRYLLLSTFDSVNNIKRNIPNDFVVGSSGANVGTFGGYLTYKSLFQYDRVAAYTFNISRYVQGIVTRKDTSFTLRLSAPVNDSIHYKTPYPDLTVPYNMLITPSLANDVANGRVRLGGGTHSRFRMRLRVIYSRI